MSLLDRIISWSIGNRLFVVIAVLSLNFLGDGMRDAADPYAQEGR